MQLIHVITTGGTIEKIYSEQRGSVENVEDRIERYLARLRLPYLETDTTRLMNKDSQERTARKPVVPKNGWPDLPRHDFFTHAHLFQTPVDPLLGHLLLHTVQREPRAQNVEVHIVQPLILVEAREDDGLLARRRVFVELQAL